MTTQLSPLRYPGGKQILLDPLIELLEANSLLGAVYAEPYAGGAGAALGLLFGEHVSELMLNDADIAIYSFWKSVLEQPENLMRLITDVPLNVDQWDMQKRIYEDKKSPTLELGFAAFYLNRCNRSGIIAKAGIIGGRHQAGQWKMDVRFNRADLVKRIERIALYADRIHVTNKDAVDFLEADINRASFANEIFVYLDPPYFNKGSQLYLNHYKPSDHEKLASYLREEAAFRWVMTYDDTLEIRSLYSELLVLPFNLRYSARNYHLGKEILIALQNLVIPKVFSLAVSHNI